MTRKILKIGNSAVITIPKKYFKELDWKIGDQIYTQFDVKNREIIVRRYKETIK